jgi:hypothetical protein
MEEEVQENNKVIDRGKESNSEPKSLRNRRHITYEINHVGAPKQEDLFYHRCGRNRQRSLLIECQQSAYLRSYIPMMTS